MVAATPPFRVQPSKGMFFDNDFCAAAVIVTGSSGASTVMSAGAPSVIAPPGTLRMRAGFTDSSSTMRGRPIFPVCTRRSNVSGTAVSRPVMPNGAWSYDSAFSSA